MPPVTIATCRACPCSVAPVYAAGRHLPASPAWCEHPLSLDAPIEIDGAPPATCPIRRAKT